MEELIIENLEEGKLPCEKAFAIAQKLRVKPAKIGKKADEMGIKISRCQLGLFGYGGQKLVSPLEEVPPELEEEIRRHSREGKLICAKAWAIARKLNLSKLEVSRAAESLGIRITECQLGCF